MNHDENNKSCDCNLANRDKYDEIADHVLFKFVLLHAEMIAADLPWWSSVPAAQRYILQPDALVGIADALRAATTEEHSRTRAEVFAECIAVCRHFCGSLKGPGASYGARTVMESLKSRAPNESNNIIDKLKEKLKEVTDRHQSETAISEAVAGAIAKEKERCLGLIERASLLYDMPETECIRNALRQEAEAIRNGERVPAEDLVALKDRKPVLALEFVKSLFEKLSDDDRGTFMHSYCHACGGHRRCRCWDDE